MLTLRQLISLKTSFFNNKKVKLVRHKDNRAEYRDVIKNRSELLEYQKTQSKPVFKGVDYIIAFIGQDGSKSLLFGVFRVCGVANQGGLLKYDLKEEAVLSELHERVIVDWGKAAVSWHQWYNKQDKNVMEILPKGYLGSFAGLTNFVLEYHELKRLYDNPDANKDWKTNLTSVNAIYLILDNDSGKQYIGSAYGKDGVWQRWSDYAENGHGDNINLKKLCLKQSGYENNFKFSILQSLPSNTTAKEVINIESLYKEKLGTRSFGLNEN